MAEEVTTTKETAADRAKREREWNKIVEALPELIHPLDLPDDVQFDLFSSTASLSELSSGGAEANIELMRRITRVMPKLFVDEDEFEAWRRTLPALRRVDTFMAIYSKYVAELGESGGSTNA